MGNARKPDGTSALECQSCHGPMAKVGADGRAGWIDLPKCQNCHYKSVDGSYVQDTSAFDAAGNFRNATSIFSTGPSLYKAATTHGGMQCESCHGSTHAEYESSEKNDNVQSMVLQKYPGVIAECSACHTATMPVSDDEGPHGLHTVGKAYLLEHDSAARRNPEACAVCHGKDFRGTKLSRTFTRRKLFDEHRKRVIYSKGEEVGCFDCHEHVP